MVWILKRSESAEKTLDFLFSAFFGSLGQAQTRTCVSVIYLSKFCLFLRHRDVLRIIFYFSIKSSFSFSSSFLSSFFPKKEERKGSKERRKKRVLSSTENSLKKHERILGTGDCRESSRKCVLDFCLRKTDKNARKSGMFAENVVLKTKPTEACGRRIAQEGLIDMFAQTSV